MISKKQGTYHHGSLQKALLDAALELVTETGIDGLSLRQVAQRAGVSSAAPYYHFADKAALVEALKIEYWKQFGESLRKAADGSGLTSRESLRAVGKAYIQFGLQNPEAFRLIFRSEHRSLTQKISGGKDECSPETKALDLVAEEGFEVLYNLVVKGQEEGILTVGDPLPLILTAWSTVHGITTLLLDGPTDKLFLSTGNLDNQIDQLGDALISTLFTGMIKPGVEN